MEGALNLSATLPPSSPIRWSQLIPPLSRARMVIVAVLLGVIYFETIDHEMVRRWWHEANWSHGWLIPVFSLYLLHSRKDQLGRGETKTSWFGAIILLASLTIFFYSAWVVPRAYPRAISLVGSIFGVTLLLGGWSVMRVAWFPILFLSFAIPLPDRLYAELTLPLRAFASKAAAAILPWFVPNLFAEAQSVVIDYMLPGQGAGRLNVDEACSGMRTLMAFVTLAFAVAYLGDRPLWQRTIIVLACLPVALVCNTIRVVVTGWLHINGHRELATGTPHEMLGIVTLVIGLGMFWLLGYAMQNLFVVEETESSVGNE